MRTAVQSSSVCAFEQHRADEPSRRYIKQRPRKHTRNTDACWHTHWLDFDDLASADRTSTSLRRYDGSTALCSLRPGERSAHETSRHRSHTLMSDISSAETADHTQSFVRLVGRASAQFTPRRLEVV